MIKAGLTFDDALKEAQALGYAEANPTADIQGDDACRKICILSALSFGFHFYPDMVKIEGIQHITPEDIAFGDALGRKIKLLGRAKRLENEQIYVSVAPYLIPNESPLATIDGVFNGIIVRGDSVDDVMFYGRGAGKLPTASAIVADVIDAAKHQRARKWMDWGDAEPSRIADCRKVEHRYFVRFHAQEPERAFAAARAVFGEIEPIACPNVSFFDGGFTVSPIAEGVFFEKLAQFDAVCGVPVVRNKLMFL